MTRWSPALLAAISVLFLSLFLMLQPSPAAAQAVSSEECADCHGLEEEEDLPYVVPAMLVGGVHEGFDCIDCHSDIEELPHDEVGKVNCGECHAEVADNYKVHGRGIVGQTPDIPGCADCHGTHKVLPATDRRSPVHPINLSRTCGRCHQDLDLVKRHQILVQHPVESYEASVHGQATHMGIHVAATCTDCHSNDGEGHNISVEGDPESSINHFNIPFTCGKCHSSIEQDFWEGIHGQLVKRGDTDAPVCTDCHGEHGILRTDDPRSRVSPIHIAGETCAPCHESARLSDKYGIPGQRLSTFIDSYHGLKSRAGDTEVANCASCHGAHRILPSSNPESSINPRRLRETCGHCHPGVTEALALTRIHETGVGRRSGWSFVITQIYLAAICIIIGGMVLYVAIDFRHHFLATLRLPQVARMTPGDVAQHWLLFLSFTALAVSGFALRYADFALFRILFGWDGGSHVRGIIHRSAAVIFILGCIWHVIYIWTRSGRRFLKDMAPRWLDFRQFGHMMTYYFGRRRKSPRFGRFGYVEKAEYWAVIWGGAVMVITGIVLWFDNYFVQILPRGLLDVMLVVHHYEAWLATLAILIWHMYSVVFKPGVFPGNPSWLTGRMPEGMHRHEHSGENTGAGEQGAGPSKTPAPPASDRTENPDR